MYRVVQRSAEMELSVSDIVSAGAGTIHGVVVGQVSPVITSTKWSDTKYFEGQISDRVKTV